MNNKIKSIEEMAILWRDAENYFIATGNDDRKWLCFEYQKEMKLSESKTKELNDLLDTVGL